MNHHTQVRLPAAELVKLTTARAEPAVAVPAAPSARAPRPARRVVRFLIGFARA